MSMKLLKESAFSHLTEYRKELIENELTEITVKRYIKDITEWLNKSPALIQKQDLLDYKKSMMVVYKLSSVNVKIVSINKYLKYLGFEELKLKAEKTTYSLDLDNMISKEEYDILLKHALKTNRKKMYCIIKTLANTGIRISELKNVTVENVGRGKAKVYSKRKERSIYFSDKLQMILEEYCRREGITSGYIFLGRDKESIITNSTINKNLKKMAIECGLDPAKIHPHSFRHLFAKRFMAINGNSLELMDLLGHKSLATTRIYNKSTGEEKRETLNKMDL